MTPKPMMKCGHSANGRETGMDGIEKPCCVICAAMTPDAFIIDPSPIVLDGRTARCAECGHKVASSETLAFFKFNGEASDFDTYYCGCRGWD